MHCFFFTDDPSTRDKKIGDYTTKRNARFRILSFSTVQKKKKTMASSAGGSELFSSYEQDFKSVTDSIKVKIEQQIPNQKGGKA